MLIYNPFRLTRESSEVIFFLFLLKKINVLLITLQTHANCNITMKFALGPLDSNISTGPEWLRIQ